MRTACLLGLMFVSACSATGKLAITPVDIRPVTQIKSEPFDPIETSELAKQYFEDENYEQAYTEFARLLAFNPDDVEAKLGAGESLLALGKYDHAALMFKISPDQKLTSINSERFELGQILSGIYTQKYDVPETAIHDGFLIRPNDARLWNAKGQFHDQNEEWMEALFSYVTALDTGEWRSGTINNMGMSLLLQGRFSEAEHKFDQAVKLSPRTQIYDNNLRMSYILQGKIKKSLEDIEESRASDIFNDAGYVAMQQDRTALAQLFFTKAIDISPVHHAKAEANLADLQAKNKAP